MIDIEKALSAAARVAATRQQQMGSEKATEIDDWHATFCWRY